MQLTLQTAAMHLVATSQHGQALSPDGIAAIASPATAAGIEPIPFAAATGESTSATLTTAERIVLQTDMRVTTFLFPRRHRSSTCVVLALETVNAPGPHLAAHQAHNHRERPDLRWPRLWPLRSYSHRSYSGLGARLKPRPEAVGAREALRHDAPGLRAVPDPIFQLLAPPSGRMPVSSNFLLAIKRERRTLR